MCDFSTTTVLNDKSSRCCTTRGGQVHVSQSSPCRRQCRTVLSTGQNRPRPELSSVHRPRLGHQMPPEAAIRSSPACRLTCPVPVRGRGPPGWFAWRHHVGNRWVSGGYLSRGSTPRGLPSRYPLAPTAMARPSPPPAFGGRAPPGPPHARPVDAFWPLGRARRRESRRPRAERRLSWCDRPGARGILALPACAHTLTMGITRGNDLARHQRRGCQSSPLGTPNM